MKGVFKKHAGPGSIMPFSVNHFVGINQRQKLLLVYGILDFLANLLREPKSIIIILSAA
jgi:hypothetical protein